MNNNILKRFYPVLIVLGIFWIGFATGVAVAFFDFVVKLFR